MAIEPEFRVGETVRLADGEYVPSESIGVRGIISKVRQGRTFGNLPRETRRWEYDVDFDPPLRLHTWILEGVLARA